MQTLRILTRQIRIKQQRRKIHKETYNDSSKVTKQYIEKYNMQYTINKY